MILNFSFNKWKVIFVFLNFWIKKQILFLLQTKSARSDPTDKNSCSATELSAPIIVDFSTGKISSEATDPDDPQESGQTGQ